LLIFTAGKFIRTLRALPMTTDVDSTLSCWCGNDALVGFDGPYRRCDACQTLVAPPPPDHTDIRVGLDETGYYGREYWFGHQQADLSLPDLASRARTDLPERCLHWLKTLLRVLLPPAKVLEIGGGHGGFVALLRQAGFDATGLELSPWVVDFARKTFDIPMLHGPIEDQPISTGSLDAIVMMDVLEHLPRPLATMEKCLSLLKPNGLLLVQTPCYPENTSIAQLRATGHKFPQMLDPSEHLFLYSQSSVRRLFAQLDTPYVEFVPAIFDFYDMALLAGRSPIHVLEPTEAADCLLATPAGRMVQAMIDLDDRRLSLLQKYRALHSSAAA
jgi:2-polyprenyl-3-methyl-5-hydroxy-6-metoxy-1,4-benzoquinol methylase